MARDKFVSSSVGKKLRIIRRRKGVKSADQLSALMIGKYSPSGIRRREEGRLKIDFKYLEDFCNALNLQDAEKDEVLTVARLDLWRSRQSVLELTKELNQIRFKSENHAKFVFNAIPGELQTFAYTTSIVRSYKEYGDEEARARERFNAAQCLIKDPRKLLRIVFAENALYAPVGSIDVMLIQLTALKEAVETQQFKFRILPSSCFLDIPNREDFAIFDSKYVVCQTRIGLVTTEEENTVRDLIKDFEALWSNAVFGEERNRIIEKATSHYSKLQNQRGALTGKG